MQDGNQPDQHRGAAQLNLIYFTFWWTSAVTLTCLAFFWVDLLPGFGTSNSFQTFIDTYVCVVHLNCYNLPDDVK